MIISLYSCDQNEQEHSGPESIPNDWFYRQRAYPTNEIPQKEVIKSMQIFNQKKRFKNFLEGYDEEWLSVGPRNIGGRITDLEMFSDDQQTILAGSASGGIFKSDDQGRTWRNTFEDALSLSIGDLAVAPSDENIIYAGTGEANAGGQSLTYDGIGIYKSTDAGETWSYANLEGVGSIGRVQVDPENADRVYVAGMGRLFGNNSQRGVFRTIDGGLNWENVLSVSDSTGAIDLAIHPQNSDIIFASMWERTRDVDGRQYGGATSGIYRSNDGGDTWEELNNGLPTEASEKGRIGLAIAPSNPNVMYAIYSGQIGFLQNVYRTSDGGNSWQARSVAGIIDVSFNWWFGKIWVDPNDENNVWVAALDMYESNDGGVNWTLRFRGAHVDQHALVIHPANTDLVIAGNDGGVYVSADNGITNFNSEDLPNIQFYTCEIDASNPERLYGGSQDNGTLRTISGADNDWSQIFGGDGFSVIVDPTNNQNVYAEAQRGFIVRSTDGGSNFRNAMNGLSGSFNWHTPIALDINTTTTLYTGAQRIFKSTNRAQSWFAISPNLTNGTTTGAINFGTITAIEVSDLDSELIYAGTDDGNVWITENGGDDWTLISDSLPNRWVTSIETDLFDSERVFVSYSGFRFDENDGQVFASFDRGDSWQNLSDNLENMPINKVMANPNQQGMLFIGTDLGVYVTDNFGDEWFPLGTNLPIVPVTDLDIHAQENFIIAATYGRSMFRYNLPQVTSSNDLAVVDDLFYPNPAVDQLNISLNESIKSIEVFDLSGRIVLKKQELLGNTLDISSLHSGSYFVRVSTKEERFVQKVVKM